MPSRFLTVCFGSPNYVSSKTPLLDFTETPNSSHQLPSKHTLSLVYPNTRLTVCASRAPHPPSTLNSHCSLNISTPSWMAFPVAKTSQHQCLSWKTTHPSRTYSMSLPLATFSPSSSTEWASRQLCSGLLPVPVVYPWAYVSPPPKRFSNPSEHWNHLGNFWKRNSPASHMEIQIQFVWGGTMAAKCLKAPKGFWSQPPPR